MKQDRKALREFIQAHLNGLNVSDAEFARKCGVSKSVISRILDPAKESQIVKPDTLFSLAIGIGISANRLFEIVYPDLRSHPTTPKANAFAEIYDRLPDDDQGTVLAVMYSRIR